jgi:hypothetical protein
LVTLENSEDTRAAAQLLLDDAAMKLAHVKQAELAPGTQPTYQQAHELLDAAQRAMAEQDYLAAESLAAKASALTAQLPPQ